MRPSRAECTALGAWGEGLVARLYGGVVVARNGATWDAMDVLAPGLAIEVKTVSHDAPQRATMTRTARLAKIRWARDRGLDGLTVVVVVHPYHADVWEGAGFKSYQVGRTKRLRHRYTVPL